LTAEKKSADMLADKSTGLNRQWSYVRHVQRILSCARLLLVAVSYYNKTTMLRRRRHCMKFWLSDHIVLWLAPVCSVCIVETTPQHVLDRLFTGGPTFGQRRENRPPPISERPKFFGRSADEGISVSAFKWFDDWAMASYILAIIIGVQDSASTIQTIVEPQLRLLTIFVVG